MPNDRNERKHADLSNSNFCFYIKKNYYKNFVPGTKFITILKNQFLFGHISVNTQFYAKPYGKKKHVPDTKLKISQDFIHVTKN